MAIYDDIKKSTKLISKTSEHEITAEFCFNRDLEVFQGHFPGMPILPGIMQLEMIRHAVEEADQKTYLLKSVRKTKFTGQIHPDSRVCVTLSLERGDDEIRVKATLTAEGKGVGKANLVLAENRV